MNNRKGILHFTLIKILKTFTPREMREFENLIKSPLYNNHSTLVKLFSELKKYYPEFADRNITKEYLFSVVNENKDKNYNDKLFRKYLSRLYKLAEDYLNLIQMRSEKEKKDFNVLMQFSKRGLSDTFRKKLNETERNFEKDKKIDSELFFVKYKLKLLTYNHLTNLDNNRSHNKELIESYMFLENYFIYNSGMLLNQIETNKFSFSNTDDKIMRLALTDRSKIIEYLEEIKLKSSEANREKMLFTELVLYDMKMNSGESDRSSYKKLRTLIYGNASKLNQQHLYYYLQRLNIFCVFENIKGKKDMNRDIFENYRMLLDNNLFNIDGFKNMTLPDFKLIISSALKINEYDWAERFVRDKVYLVKEELRNNLFHFGNSLLKFQNNDFAGSLDHILKIKNESMPVTVDIYLLKAKIYFELGYADSANSLADAFGHFVSNNKLMADFMKRSLKNFLKYYKILLRSETNPHAVISRTKLKNLITEAERNENIRDKKWLIEKAGKMISQI